MQNKTHELKTWPPYYFDIEIGLKNFEMRKADRHFVFGDTLILKEYDPETGYTGRKCNRQIQYILADPNFVKEGYVILGIGKQ